MKVAPKPSSRDSMGRFWNAPEPARDLIPDRSVHNPRATLLDAVMKRVLQELKDRGHADALVLHVGISRPQALALAADIRRSGYKAWALCRTNVQTGTVYWDVWRERRPSAGQITDSSK